MALAWDDIQSRALTFSKKWESREGKEKQQAQMFVKDFLFCFGIDDPLENGEYEHKCPKEVGDDGYIDYFSPGKIIIEMKTQGKSLDKAFEQVKDYVFHLPTEEIPALIMVSDFDTIILYHRTTAKRIPFKTKDLRKHVMQFANIAGYETTRTYDNQVEVNVKAAEKMASLHDTLKMYGYEGHNLEVYLVRLLFCLFADDTGIFPKDSFLNYVENSKEDGSDLPTRLAKLFEILNTSDEERKKRSLLSADLLQFRYINGGLFANTLPIADFNDNMRKTLLDCCTFDWNKISPAIFGSMFQGVMDEDRRRELGAHYTSGENILKLINPLFMDELYEEFEKVKSTPQLLDAFHTKIARLKFLDPACGCGNFLIITYRELRILELEILKMKNSSNQMLLDISDMLKVSVEQFYGIEYEDFPCEIAKVGMWLMDHQMNLLFAEQFGTYYARLPLTESATIVHANALTTDWEDVVAKTELSYILGNPPFVGMKYQSGSQKSDMAKVFSTVKNYGALDYVTSWFYLASKYVKNTKIRFAFVATNSIAQGEQVSILWQALTDLGMKIDFGYQTFIWTNEAKGKAAVHCVIVGISDAVCETERYLYSKEGMARKVFNINAFLVDAPNVLITNRTKPLCNVPKIIAGNKPVDGDFLKIEKEDYEDFIRQEPNACRYIKKLIGGYELINNQKRFVLWLVDINPEELRKMPLVLDRVKKVKEARLLMEDAGARKLADTPTTFRDTLNPSRYVAIPIVSSERRVYVPMAFLDGETIPTNQVQIIPDAEIFHFGILESSVHMCWMRAICGRLKSDYRYTAKIVYNNFPWVSVTDDQKTKIEQCAQSVLDVREKFPNSSLADLYDPLTMPPDLLKAHQSLDKEVMKAYGFSTKDTEAEIVAKLMEMYRKLINNE